MKFLSRLRLGLSYLKEHKLKRSFQDSFTPFGSCGKCEVETSSHYLLYCSNYLEKPMALLNTIKNSDKSILQQEDSKFTSILHFNIYISYSGEKTTPFSKKYFDMMSSTVLLQLNFYLQKFIFYNAKINHSNHL